MVREIPLTQGKVALVDDWDYDRVVQFGWYLDAEKRPGKSRDDVFYARRSYRNEDGDVRCERLHHFILGTRERTDHIDLDGLNNQRSNLRLVTPSQSSANRRKKSGSASRFKGLSIVAGRQVWRAEIQVNGRRIHLGYFAEEEEAAKAYDAAALESFGEFARLNFPRGA